MPAAKEFGHAPIPLTGRLILAEDPVNIGTNFQELINLRYTDARLKAIRGMTKLTPSQLNYPKLRSIHQFRKSVPMESHALAQALSSDESNSAVFLNDDDLPNQSDFLGSVWNDAVAGQRGYFSDGPQGQLIYCNGQESVIWGGYESSLGAFIHFKNSDDTLSKDFGDQLRSIDRDADGIAVLDIQGSGFAVDPDTLLLLHCDGANNSTTFTDSSPTTPHTMAANGNAKITTTSPKFVTGCATFDGTGDYLSTADNADFDFSAGVWTIDLWVKLTTLPTSPNFYVLYYQGTDASNYFVIRLNYLGQINLKIVAATVVVVDLLSTYAVSHSGVWNHIAIQESGDTYSFYVQGAGSTGTDTDRAANYTGPVYIGADSSGGSGFKGQMDEIRLSAIARYSGDFTPPSNAYGAGGSSSTCYYVGSTRPLESFKEYVQTPNTAASTRHVYYWDGANWERVSNLVDGTAVTGVPLAQTGIVSFDSTVGVAKIKQINGTFLYWYRVELYDAVDITTSLYYVTLRPSWQTLADIWDGVNRDEISFFRLASGKYQEWTPNVLQDNYSSIDVGTYASFTMATTDYLYAGFIDRTRAIQVKMIPAHENTTANTQAIVEYWNGIAWTTVSGIDDGTSVNGISLSKSGIIAWDPPDKSQEFKYDLLSIPVVPTVFTKVGGRGGQVSTPSTAAPGTVTKPINQNTPPLYFYRISFSVGTSALQVFYVSGVPSPNPPKGYSYSFQADNRQWLCDERLGDRNKVKVCSANAPDVWNGDDTAEFFFGDDERVTCGGEFYVRTADSFTTLKVIFKDDEMHAVSGLTIQDYQQLVISSEIGCPAPDTLKVVKWKKGIVMIWQSSHGIYLFDGIAPIDISNDMRHFFTDGIITPAMLGKSSSFIDELNKEYHWIFSTDGATLNREFVYDLERSQPSEGVNKWYEVNRTPTLKLTCGTNAIDSLGAHYTLGCLDTGYVELLENGTTFDGNDMDFSFRTGDINMANDIMVTHTVHAIKLISVCKALTANQINLQIYYDGHGVFDATFQMGPNKTSYRVVDSLVRGSYGPATYFSFRYYLATNNENPGFEPLALAVSYKEATSDI